MQTKIQYQYNQVVCEHLAKIYVNVKNKQNWYLLVFDTSAFY